MKLLSKKINAAYNFEASNLEALLLLEKNKERLYLLPGPTDIKVATNCGVLHISIERNFMFDGRSGGRCIDWYVPNLGTLDERICWLVHDCNGYAKCLDFKTTNKLLYVMLRDLAGYSSFKAKVIQTAVSLSKKWFGQPNSKSKLYEFQNDKNLKIRWIE